jgi:hypothetical protein
MDKKELIDGLIANEFTQFVEEDRAALEAQDEKLLALMTPVVPEQNAKADDEETPEEKAKRLAKEKAEKAAQNAACETVDEYVNNAPEEMQDVLRSGLAAHNAEKTRLVTAIVANKLNVFTKEQLEGKKLDELKGIAALAATAPRKNFAGQADPPVANADAETPLPLPVMNFERK